MRKIFFILFIFLFSFYVYPQSDAQLPAQKEDSQNEIAGQDEEQETDESGEKKEKKKPFRMPNRVFELGIANFDIGFGNNLINITDVINDERKLLVDLTRLEEGFFFGLNINVRPLYFNINIKDKWGFGLDIANVTSYGNINIAADLININQTVGEEFGAGASAFVDVGIPIFFHIDNVRDKKFKIFFRPAGFVTAFYTKPEMIYTFKEVENGDKKSLLMEVDYLARIYTPVSVDPDVDMLSTLNLGKSIGVDLSIGAEYQLFDWLDLGVNVKNISIVPTRLNHYAEVKDKIIIDTSGTDLIDIIKGNSDTDNIADEIITRPDDINIIYGVNDEDILVTRPFKTILHANFRPFRSPGFVVTPKIGFSVNDVFVQKYSIEGGLDLCFDLSNMFITKIGVNYEDQMWRNGIAFIFNFRVIEFGIGASIQSQEFLKSWLVYGARVNFGLKIGF